jgi:undecaprenyl-diphosphatase
MRQLLRRLVGWAIRRLRPRPPVMAGGADTGPVALVPVARRRPLRARLVALRTRLFANAALIGGVVFAALSWLVGAGHTAGIDLALARAVQAPQHPLVAALMAGVSQLGFPPFSFLLVLGVAGAFLAARRPTEAGILTAAAAGSALLATSIQSLHARPRPEAGVLRVTSELPYYSFPSGHTIMYVAFFGFLAYLGYTRLRPGRLRTLLLAALGALIVLVGPSRVYLGHHWPSDVLAAYALGLVYLVVLVRLYARQQLARVPALGPVV